MTTTYMNLTLPTVSSTIGPDWASQLNAALTVVDSHDHSSGKGQRVPVAGININADLPFNSKVASNIGAATFSNLSATLSDLNTLYVNSGDLYFNDASGANIRLTASGALNTASVGGITGDYSSTSASVYYTDSTKTYTFEDSDSVNSDIEIGPLVCTTITASSTVTAGGAVTVSGTTTLNGTTTVAGTTTFSGAATFSGNTSGRGIVPVGAILPLMANLTGVTNVTATTTADSNGYVVCGGQTISDATSPMNGQVIPNLNNSNFIMGSSTAGSTGGANSITITESQLPSHTHTIDHGHADTFALSNNTVASSTHNHDISHTHMWSHYDDSTNRFYALDSSDTSVTAVTSSDSNIFRVFADLGSGSTDDLVGTGLDGTGNQSLYTTGVIDAPTGSGNSAVSGAPSATTTVSLSGAVTSHSGNSGSTGSGSSVDNRPSYITCKYIMRVK